jgi:creatinine amidohydrolase
MFTKKRSGERGKPPRIRRYQGRDSATCLAFGVASRDAVESQSVSLPSIHPSAWKCNSRNFISEAALVGEYLPRGESMFSVNNSTRDLYDAGIDTAILSVGATEQCGPHLPLNIDTLVAEYHARAWGEVLGAYVLPTLPFNTSEEHASFKGTVSLGPSTLMLVLEQVVEGLRAQGFRKQVLTVGHGGSLWMGAFVKHVNYRFGDTVVVDAHQGAAPVWEEALHKSDLAGRGDVHGGAGYRALALYLAPTTVKEGAYGTRIPERMSAFADYVGWETFAPDGSWGRYEPKADSEVATAEAGKVLLEHFVKGQGARLKEHLQEACRLKGI